MKIGILTYHRSHNYGALLQAIALRHYLSLCGHDTYFIDYWPDYHKDMYKLFSRSTINELSLKRKVKYLLKRILYSYGVIKRIKLFKKFIAAHIDSFCLNTSDSFDMIVYGSDQIWRIQNSLNDFNPVYFGDHHIKTDKHVSYAASMGKLNVDNHDGNKIKSWLNKFKAISVRESDLKSLLDSWNINDVRVVSDPTLLLSENQWRQIINIRRIDEKYILYYDLIQDSFDNSKIKKFAKEKDLKIVELKGSIDKLLYSKNERAWEDPSGMLSLIANAEYVFTSSYHGLLFSIIFHKQVYVAFKENSGRAASILDELGINERLIRDKSSEIPLTNIDYTIVSNKLKNLRGVSNQFISEFIRM